MLETSWDTFRPLGETTGLNLKAAKAAPPMDSATALLLEDSRPMWTLAEGVEFARKIEHRFGRTSQALYTDGKLVGRPRDKFHFSLGGSVLYHGHSDKDLDIIVRRGVGWIPGDEDQLDIYMETSGYALQKFFGGGVKQSEDSYGDGRLQTAENIRVYYQTNGTGKRVDLFLQNNKLEDLPPVMPPPQSNSLGIDDLLDVGPVCPPPLNEDLPAYPPPKYPPPPRLVFSGLNMMAR